tara:strand:+ start:1562 stop:1882 length:321 start_codon:yes stop_codon:yes gene_type:complete
MKIFKLEDMTGGWFVGDFSPSVVKTKECEVALKEYKAGDKENRHHHKEAIEVTLIARGTVEMNGNILEEGSIIHLDKGEPTDFKSITDSITVVFKSPSVTGDKYLD